MTEPADEIESPRLSSVTAIYLSQETFDAVKAQCDRGGSDQIPVAAIRVMVEDDPTDRLIKATSLAVACSEDIMYEGGQLGELFTVKGSKLCTYSLRS